MLSPIFLERNLWGSLPSTNYNSNISERMRLNSINISRNILTGEKGLHTGVPVSVIPSDHSRKP